MSGAVRIAFVAFIIRVTYAGYCRTSYPCQSPCLVPQKYYTGCGLFWLSRCARYRNVYQLCARTCYRSVCCSGYSGSSCNIPSCFGSNTCPNGGTCIYPNMCRCPRGFSSPRCIDFDECSSSTHGCQHICVNTHGSYRCTCRVGFTLSSDLKSCIDFNECNAHNGGCSHICNDNVGSFSCSCRDGYELGTDGRSCYDLDECSLGISACSQKCTNTDGSFTCSCNTGYALSVDRRSCEDVDECVDGTAICEGYCNNTAGSYTCNCGYGYILGNNGFSCKDLDECETGNGGCDQICTNVEGSYRCECQTGYKAVNTETNSKMCEDIDECMESSALCNQICENTDGSYKCSCNTGFKLDTDGNSCIDVDDCLGVSCINEGVCVDGLNKYTCMCETGFTGKHCETDINECDIANGGCQDVCTNTKGTFKCSCFETRELQADGFSCVGEEKESENVFQRFQIPRQLLPTPCFSVALAKCIDGNDMAINLTSTSEWYKLTADHDVIFTLGVVFVNVNNFSVPLSIKGIEVTLGTNEFTLNYGVLYDFSQGTVIENVKTSHECESIELVESDIFDLISNDSFMKTLLLSLFPATPYWLRFEKSSQEMLSIQDTKTDLVYGRDMDDVLWCDGAPVLAGHLYTVFRFNTGFKLNIFGDEIDISNPLISRKFCLIVDLCQHNGGTVFLMVPEGSRDMLLDISMFQALKNRQNLQIRPRGIGLSLSKGINANYYTLSGQLWNGDTMFSPFLPTVNAWIGGTLTKHGKFYEIEGNADVYVGVPSVQTMMTSMFVEEWTGFIDIQLSLLPVLRFKSLGKERSITFSPVASSTLNAFISIGGSNRKWCGAVSNPEGIFLSLTVDINPFEGIPFLGDFVFSSVTQVHTFLTTDPQDRRLEEIDFSIMNDIFELGSLLNKTTYILEEALHHTELALLDRFQAVVLDIKDSFNTIKDIINVRLKNLLTGNINALIEYIENIRHTLDNIRSTVYALHDETEFIINETKDKFLKLIEDQVKVIEANIGNITAKITDTITYTVGNYTGFGLKFASELTFLGLQLPLADFEIMYSEGDLFRCSRFEEVKKLLKDESALRVLARSYLGFKLGRFLNIQIGGGFGIAFSTNSLNALLQMQAHIQMLGISVTGDVFISSKTGLYLYLEGNVWNIFLAQIDVVAEVGKDWDKLSFNLRGRFVAKARKRRDFITETSLVEDNHLQFKRIGRQVQTDSSSFQGSYLDGLKNVIKMTSDEAQKRLTQVQRALTSAQHGLTKAQEWLDKRQDDLEAANEAFDNAVEKLEQTKRTLEIAKGPLTEALQKLEKTQRNINNLCRIRSCGSICLPGLKCKICFKKVWFANIPYPCCEFTRCMLRVPDIFCEIANLACRIIRAAAYVILQMAKIFVRVAMFAYDVAIAAVSTAQFLVDKSRVVLHIAEGILELAKIGLDVANVVLEAAKFALEAVKIVIGAAADVLQYVIEYGLKSIIDVKNCGFDIELSTKDLPVFEVSCEVNAFNLGWNKIKLKINFYNILQSIWQAAKATIKAIMNTFGGIFSGRKRRDIEFDASSRMHVLLRKIRDVEEVNSTIYNLNETIDLSKDISGFRDSNDSDSESRIELFREKCITITLIQDFMQDAFDSLQEVVNDSKAYIGEIDKVKRQLQGVSSVRETSQNMTSASLGISSEYAAMDYNMTENDIDKAMNDTKSAASKDPLLIEIQSAATVSSKSVDDEIKAVEQIDYQQTWFTLMKNMTKDYFNESECENFQDCIFYSISTLYVLYESEDFPNISSIQTSILDLESLLIETFQNESSSIMDTSAAFEYVVLYIENLVSMNLFCSQVPTFVNQVQNQTVLIGSDVKLFCNATGDPEPYFFWLLNETIIPGESFKMLTVSNVTENASYDKYNCIVGNIVANITSSDAYINVVLHDENECDYDGHNCTHVCTNTIGSYMCSCLEGYFLDEDGRTCSDIDECSTDTRHFGCDHICNNTDGSFICSCKNGYELQADMRKCVDTNECFVNNGGCDHICSNINGSFTCSCNDGFGLHEDEKTCVDSDECMADNGGCDHTCINTDGSFICSCNKGFSLHENNGTCVDINECLDDNGGCHQTCSNTNGSLICSCNEGYSLYEDNRTCVDLDECSTYNGGCDHICRNTNGSFICLCNDGYYLQEENRTCVDIDECFDDNGSCDHVCSNRNGSFTCICYDGYSLLEDNRTCVDINECLDDNGGCDQMCGNTNGSYTCFCKDGYYLLETTKSCVEIDECQDDGVCDHICHNTEGSFTCSCKDGYNLHDDMRACIEINECHDNNGRCDHKCSNKDGSFICSCNSGYSLHENKRTCVDKDECLNGNDGCEHACYNTNGSFACSCKDGYKLHEDMRHCDDINECLDSNGDCDQTCINTNGSFICICRYGYTLNKNQLCVDIDECVDNNGGCEHNCKNVDGFFTCTCNDGYQLDNDSLSCFDTNECADNNGSCEETCINFDGTYICVCPQKRRLSEDGLSCEDMTEPAIISTLRLSIESETAIKNYYLYTEIKDALEGYFRAATEASIFVDINSIRAGSVIVDYTVVIGDNETQTSVVDTVVQAIMGLDENGSLIIGGAPVSVKSILPVSADPCELRVKLAGYCDKNTYCHVDGSMPICRKTYEKNVNDDYLKIVGPVLGVVACLVTVILLAICVLNRKKWWPNKVSSNESGECAATPYLGWNGETGDFNSKAPYSTFLQSANDDDTFSKISNEKDLKSTNMDTMF